MLKHLRALIPMFLVYSCSSYAAAPNGLDTVAFKNRDTLTGTIVSVTPAAVVFFNSAVGSLTLKWSDIETLGIQHRVQITFEGAATPRDFTNPQITVDASSTSTHLNLGVKEGNRRLVAIKDAQSIAIDPNPAAASPPGWISTISGSAAFVVSTQHQQTYGAGITLLRNWSPSVDGWPHKRSLIDLSGKYDEKRKNPNPGSATITDYYIGKFQQYFFLTSNRFYASTTSDLVRNNSLGLYFQQAYGAGLGMFVNRLQLAADFRFIGEHFYGHNPSAALAGAELSERYDFPLDVIRKGASLTQTGIFVPVFNASRAWQAREILDLTVPITVRWSLTTKLEDYYVENAPSPFRKNYLNTSIGLKFSPTAKH